MRFNKLKLIRGRDNELWDYEFAYKRHLVFGDFNNRKWFNLISGVSSIVRVSVDVSKLTDYDLYILYEWIGYCDKHIFLLEFSDWRMLGRSIMPDNVVWCTTAKEYGDNEAFLECFDGVTGVFWRGGDFVRLDVDAVFMMGIGMGKQRKLPCCVWHSNMVCDGRYGRWLGGVGGSVSTKYDVWKLF